MRASRLRFTGPGPADPPAAGPAAPGAGAEPPRDDPAPSPWRYVLYLAGAAMIFIGVKGIVHNTHRWEQPVYWVKLFVAGAVVHDLVLAPVVFAVAFVLLRTLPARYRGPVQAGLFASAVLTLIALPGLRRYGAPADNPSVQPVNYAHGLALVLGVIWLLVLGAVLWRRTRPHRSGAEGD